MKSITLASKALTDKAHSKIRNSKVREKSHSLVIRKLSGGSMNVMITCFTIRHMSIQLSQYDTNSNIKLLQYNELNRGHPTLISQSQVTFTTKESGFGGL